MSKSYIMQKPLIFLAGAASALLGITAFMASGDAVSVPSGVPPVLVSPRVPEILLAANDSKQPVESPSPSPGLYRATPYTMLVVVPKPVDERMVVRVGDALRFTMPRIKPETRLEPMTPLNTALEQLP